MHPDSVELWLPPSFGVGSVLLSLGKHRIDQVLLERSFLWLQLRLDVFIRVGLEPLIKFGALIWQHLSRVDRPLGPLHGDLEEFLVIDLHSIR